MREKDPVLGVEVGGYAAPSVAADEVNRPEGDRREMERESGKGIERIVSRQGRKGGEFVPRRQAWAPRGLGGKAMKGTLKNRHVEAIGKRKTGVASGGRD